MRSQGLHDVQSQAHMTWVIFWAEGVLVEKAHPSVHRWNASSTAAGANLFAI